MIQFVVSGSGAIACIPKVPPCGCTEVSLHHIFRAQRSVKKCGCEPCSSSGFPGLHKELRQPVVVRLYLPDDSSEIYYFLGVIDCGNPCPDGSRAPAREVSRLGLFRLIGNFDKKGLKR